MFFVSSTKTVVLRSKPALVVTVMQANQNRFDSLSLSLSLFLSLFGLQVKVCTCSDFYSRYQEWVGLMNSLCPSSIFLSLSPSLSLSLSIYIYIYISISLFLCHLYPHRKNWFYHSHCIYFIPISLKNCFATCCISLSIILSLSVTLIVLHSFFQSGKGSSIFQIC